MMNDSTQDFPCLRFQKNKNRYWLWSLSFPLYKQKTVELTVHGSSDAQELGSKSDEPRGKKVKVVGFVAHDKDGICVRELGQDQIAMMLMFTLQLLQSFHKQELGEVGGGILEVLFDNLEVVDLGEHPAAHGGDIGGDLSFSQQLCHPSVIY